jgi:hypothetical protein
MRTVEHIVTFNKPKMLDRESVTGLNAIGSRGSAMSLSQITRSPVD